MDGSSRRLGPRRTAAGMAGLVAGLAVLVAWPLSGNATGGELVERLTSPVADVVGVDAERLAEDLAREPERAVRRAANQQEDPKTEPPLHGTGPHAQGTVGSLDVNPSSERPQAGDPTGSENDEEAVVGRARGEQGEDGAYHGHITILALFGNEILGVDTGPGDTEHGPLNAVQEGLLTPLCDGSGNQICLTVLRADSSTTDNGSANRFAVARATLGGADGLDAGAAESSGDISDDGTCQAARGDSSVANVRAGGQAVADVARSSSESRACKGQAPTQSNESRVIALGGTGVPFPAAGCADGTPDVVTGIPTLAPVVCNADDASGAQADTPYGVREALSVFVLDVGSSQLLKVGTAASESRAQAPRPECSDARDNDGDGVIDAADPGCHTDGDPGNPDTYDPNDDDETDERRPQCSDTADNDGDGVIDAADPGCHTDGDPGNPASYDPQDDDERDPGDGGQGTGGPDGPDGGPGGGDGPAGDRREAGQLPMTGTDALLLAMAGLFLLAAGLDLRRRVRLEASG